MRRGHNAFLLVVMAGLVTLAACQSERRPARPPAPASSGKSASLRTMEQVGRAAYQCWFASKDPAFRPYSFANELNSMSGQPRFLLVPAKNFGGRPLLVVQARGSSSRLETFGPLLDGPLSSRVRSDLARWERGSLDCGSAT